ncbi:MAG: hypothetical protein FWH23_00095 [Bacteroidales bacterium]|nr:hypothetical protein [Bacteroidales bacterium]
MTIKKKNLILQFRGVFALIILVFFALPLFFKKIHVAVPKWMESEMRGVIIMIILIVYSILELWLQNFFKKKWNERDYTPIIVIIIAVLLGIALM